MNTEFFEALTMLEKEKGIPADYLLEKIKNAITTLSLEFTMQNELINKLVKISQNFNDISNKIAQNSAKIKANFDKISEI